MTPEQIIEGNKLIAIFMGWEYFGFNDERLQGKYRPGWKKKFNAPAIEKIYYKDYLCRNNHELKYHSSWDWLMPVVEKINLIVENMSNPSNFDYDIFESMQKWILGVNIRDAWGDAISIIQWYNSEKQNPKP